MLVKYFIIFALPLSNPGIQPINKSWGLETTFLYNDWSYFNVNFPLKAQAVI